MSINTLALLAYKVAPNMFDLSTGLSHVSLRDQVIRGATLVRDLLAAGLLTRDDEVLIVGAGAAGVSAARHASLAGCRSLLVDTGSEPFGLQANVETRYVGPYMYEWPWGIHSDQHFAPPASSLLHHWNTASYDGLTINSKHPLTGKDLADDWQAQLKSWILSPGSKLSVLTHIDPTSSLAELKAWRRRQRFWMPGSSNLQFQGNDWPNTAWTPESINPKFVILAAGFGPERVTWEGPAMKKISGPIFWASDTLSKPNCGFATEPTIVVLGGGDGAMQDALRCLFPHPQPLETLAELLKFPKVAKAFQQSHTDILLAELQHAATRTWTTGASQATEFESLQQAYLDVLQQLGNNPDVQCAMFDLLRQDVKRVALVVRENYLGKAYPLNRFLILLLAECFKSGSSPNNIEFDLLFNTEASDITVARPYIVTLRNLLSGASTTIGNVHHLSIRFGVMGDQAPGQLMGLTKKDTKNRRELANIPQSLWPIP